MNAKESMGKRNGKQNGDPMKGGAAMYKIGLESDPPVSLPSVNVGMRLKYYIGSRGSWLGCLRRSQ